MDSRVGVPTRRQYLKYGGAVVTGGMLAGCSSSGGEQTSGDTSTGETSSTNGTSGASETSETTDQGGEDGPYSVTMSPVGEVEFESVPENVMIYSLLYADAAVAYGHGDAVNSLGFDSEAGGNTLDAYYERLDDVSFDRDGLTQLNSGSGGVNIDKELFYKLDSDLHMIDPALVVSFKGWEKSDIEEIQKNVAPWFGNNYSRRNSQPPKAYRDDYQYYTLWEIAEKVAAVFREEERHAKLAAVHDDLVDRIQSNLPPEDERPTVGSVIFMQGTFYPSKINTAGFANAHVRPARRDGCVRGERRDVPNLVRLRNDAEGRSRRHPASVRNRFVLQRGENPDAVRRRSDWEQAHGRQKRRRLSVRKPSSGSAYEPLPVGDDGETAVSRAVRRVARIHERGPLSRNSGGRTTVRPWASVGHRHGQ